MPITINGKRIILTGGARGIGAAAMKHFVSEGADVIAFDNRAEGADIAEASNASGPGTARFRQVDVADEAAVQQAVDDAVGSLGGLDAVFNIAGVELSGAAEDLTRDAWQTTIDVNVMGVVNVCKASFPHLRKEGGAIVNFSSDAALVSYPDGAHYSASKGAVISYSRTLAGEWGRYGIRVNSLVPAIWTPMYDEHRSRLKPEELQAHDAMMAQLVPLGGKLGDPDNDLAPVLAFLASDASKFITAQIISVNGGLGSTR